MTFISSEERQRRAKKLLAAMAAQKRAYKVITKSENYTLYKVQLEQQRECCLICVEAFKINGFRPGYDKNKKLIGLLCTRCYNGLSNFRYNIDYIEAAIEYLKRKNVA